MSNILHWNKLSLSILLSMNFLNVKDHPLRIGRDVGAFCLLQWVQGLSVLQHRWARYSSLLLKNRPLLRHETQTLLLPLSMVDVWLLPLFGYHEKHCHERTFPYKFRYLPLLHIHYQKVSRPSQNPSLIGSQGTAELRSHLHHQLWLLPSTNVSSTPWTGPGALHNDLIITQACFTDVIYSHFKMRNLEFRRFSNLSYIAQLIKRRNQIM